MTAVSITLAAVVLAWVVYSVLRNNKLRAFRRNLTLDQVVTVSYSDEDYFEVVKLIPEHEAATLKNVINDTQITVSIRNIYPV